MDTQSVYKQALASLPTHKALKHASVYMHVNHIQLMQCRKSACECELNLQLRDEPMQFVVMNVTLECKIFGIVFDF